MDNNTQDLVSIVLPMYNESAAIVKNINALIVELEKLPCAWEVLLINDGSTDDSLQKSENALKNQKNFRLISYMPNRGRGYALRMGFLHAKGNYIITTESDLSWGATIILMLWERLRKEDVDIVVASPYLKGGRLENIPWRRAFLSRFGNKILCRAVPGNLTMISGMTRGYKRKVIDLLDLESDGKEIHLEIISKALTLGFRIKEIPAILRWEKPKHGKRKRVSNFKAKELIQSHLFFSFSESPIILLGTLSMVLILCGLSIGIYLIHLSLFQGIKIGGRPIIILMALFILVGLQTLVFCFVANQNRDARRHLVKLESKISLLLKHIRKE